MFASLECCLAETGLCHGGRRQSVRCRQLAHERPGRAPGQAGGALSVDVTLGLSEHVVMPSDIRCSGRRSLEKPSREWKAIGRIANERKISETAAIGKTAFGKTGRLSGIKAGKSTQEEMRLRMEPRKEKRRSEERLVLPETARRSGRAPWD